MQDSRLRKFQLRCYLQRKRRLGSYEQLYKSTLNEKTSRTAIQSQWCAEAAKASVRHETQVWNQLWLERIIRLVEFSRCEVIFGNMSVCHAAPNTPHSLRNPTRSPATEVRLIEALDQNTSFKENNEIRSTLTSSFTPDQREITISLSREQARDRRTPGKSDFIACSIYSAICTNEVS